MKRVFALMVIAAIASAPAIDIPQPVWTNHNRLVGSTKVMTNFQSWAESIQSAVEHGGGSDQWDLFLTKAETILASAYRGAFDLHGVYSLSDANTITIGGMAFAYLPNLKEVVLGNVGSIANDALYGCNLDLLEISNKTAYVSCGGVASVRVLRNTHCLNIASGGERVNVIEEADFPNATTSSGSFGSLFVKSSIHGPKIVRMPSLILTQTGMFGSYYGGSGANNLLEEVHFRDIVHIGFCSFEGCSSLKTIYGVENVTNIESRAFQSCSSLKSLGDLISLESVGVLAFNGCNSIDSLTFSNKTHSEVESINGFSDFPNRGTACVFHCSDGDFYRSGNTLIPMP